MEAKDTVGVVCAWEYPVFKMPEIDNDAIASALEAIEAGGPYRSNQQATTHPWVGIPIAKALKIKLTKRGKKTLNNLIEDWLQDGFLRKVTDTDPVTRKSREFIEVCVKPLSAGKKQARF